MFALRKTEFLTADYRSLVRLHGGRLSEDTDADLWLYTRRFISLSQEDFRWKIFIRGKNRSSDGASTTEGQKNTFSCLCIRKKAWLCLVTKQFVRKRMDASEIAWCSYAGEFSRRQAVNMLNDCGDSLNTLFACALNHVLRARQRKRNLNFKEWSIQRHVRCWWPLWMTAQLRKQWYMVPTRDDSWQYVAQFPCDCPLLPVIRLTKCLLFHPNVNFWCLLIHT